jgi:hypothetical protein
MFPLVYSDNFLIYNLLTYEAVCVSISDQNDGMKVILS